MVRLSTSVARQRFSEILSRAEYAGERTVLHRRQKPVAAVVPIQDLELIERIENEIDVKAVRKARKEKGAIAWERIKKEAGL
jgi:antitoxin (DNA-binding transcriptional repressor) of toxin-antitoxin stability system